MNKLCLSLLICMLTACTVTETREQHGANDSLIKQTSDKQEKPNGPYRSHYKKGIIQTKYSYYLSENMKEKFHYKKDKLDGKILRYNRNGKVIDSQIHQVGERIQ